MKTVLNSRETIVALIVHTIAFAVNIFGLPIIMLLVAKLTGAWMLCAAVYVTYLLMTKSHYDTMRKHGFIKGRPARSEEGGVE